jgi:hypothetical protein
MVTECNNARLPQFVKTAFLLDLPMFQFDEVTDGKHAYEEERQKMGNNTE